MVLVHHAVRVISAHHALQAEHHALVIMLRIVTQVLQLLIECRQVNLHEMCIRDRRYALAEYGFRPGQGLVTDMNAIRRDEELDNLSLIHIWKPAFAQ